MVDDRDPLFREIDEELRREQLQKLWNQYGTYIILAVALLILGVAGYKWMEARRAAEANAAGARYQAVISLLEQGKTDQAREELKALADSGPAGYAALAELQLAATALSAGKTAEAAAAYDKLANDGRADPLLRDFARLQSASLMVGTASWTEMQNRLNPLLGEKSPWRYSARELLGLAAIRSGEIAEAKKIYGELLTEQKVPPSIQERARMAMSLLAGVDEAKLFRTEGSVRPGSGAAGAGGSPATQK
jgi:hypothetical protein